MKVIICGSRRWTDRNYPLILLTVQSLPPGTTVIHGAAAGVDTLAQRAAAECRLSFVSCPAAWDSFGKSAGPRRNQQMLEMRPDLVIGFTDNVKQSIGTMDMIGRAVRAGVPTFLMNSRGELWMRALTS